MDRENVPMPDIEYKEDIDTEWNIDQKNIKHETNWGDIDDDDDTVSLSEYKESLPMEKYHDDHQSNHTDNSIPEHIKSHLYKSEPSQEKKESLSLYRPGRIIIIVIRNLLTSKDISILSPINCQLLILTFLIC